MQIVRYGLLTFHEAAVEDPAACPAVEAGQALAGVPASRPTVARVEGALGKKETDDKRNVPNFFGRGWGAGGKR